MMNTSLIVICTTILSFAISLVFIRGVSSNIYLIIALNALSMVACMLSMFLVFKHVKSYNVRNTLGLMLFVMFVNHLLSLVFNSMLFTNAKKYGIVFFAIDPKVIYNFNRASMVFAFISFVTAFTLNN